MMCQWKKWHRNNIRSLLWSRWAAVEASALHLGLSGSLFLVFSCTYKPASIYPPCSLCWRGEAWCPLPLVLLKWGTQGESVKVTLTGQKHVGINKIFPPSSVLSKTTEAGDGTDYLVRGLTLRQVPPGHSWVLLQQPCTLRGAEPIHLPMKHCQKQNEAWG